MGPLKFFCLMCLLLPGLGVTASCGWAQTDAQPKKIDVPAPERVLLKTKDNVELTAEWYGGFGGKDAVPVILVHDWDGSRKDLLPLAEFLQKKHGYAVIVPDLRGHGESLSAEGVDDPLDRERFKKVELASMVEDIDSCRRYLQDKNDAGELNLDMLVVLACGKMGIHAANWCILDWRWGPIGNVKQGRNVKSLILVSPQKRFKSLNITPAIKTPLFAGREAALPLLLMWGAQDQSSAVDGESIFNLLKKERGQPDDFADDRDRLARQNLFQAVYPSGANGAELLNVPKVAADIVLFIDQKVVAKKDVFLWQSRAKK